MAIRKGDLVKIDFSLVKEKEISQELFKSILIIKNKEDFFLVSSNPYENQVHQIMQIYANHAPLIFNSLTISVDLILGNKFYKGVPVKYLERIS